MSEGLVHNPSRAGIRCPHCRQRYLVPQEFLGKSVRCARCEQGFLIVRLPRPGELALTQVPIVFDADLPDHDDNHDQQQHDHHGTPEPASQPPPATSPEPAAEASPAPTTAGTGDGPSPEAPALPIATELKTRDPVEQDPTAAVASATDRGEDFDLFRKVLDEARNRYGDLDEPLIASAATSRDADTASAGTTSPRDDRPAALVSPTDPRTLRRVLSLTDADRPSIARQPTPPRSHRPADSDAVPAAAQDDQAGGD